jgi:hypothetical protein
MGEIDSKRAHLGIVEFPRDASVTATDQREVGGVAGLASLATASGSAVGAACEALWRDDGSTFPPGGPAQVEQVGVVGDDRVRVYQDREIEDLVVFGVGAVGLRLGHAFVVAADSGAQGSTGRPPSLPLGGVPRRSPRAMPASSQMSFFLAPVSLLMHVMMHVIAADPVASPTRPIRKSARKTRRARHRGRSGKSAAKIKRRERSERVTTERLAA